MFPPSLKNALLFFALGLLLGLFLSLLWKVTAIPEYTPVGDRPTPGQLEKTVATTERVLAKKVDSLHVQNEKLVMTLSETNIALAKAQKKTGDLRRQLFTLLDQRFERQRQRPDSPTGYSHTPCDSIAGLLSVYMATADEKDSLYRSAITNLEGQGQNKDSLLFLHQQQYAALKSSFLKSIEAQTSLVTENKTLTKTVRRQKVKSKILSAVFLLVSGAAAPYLIHH